jgi:hypothetical protein
LTAYFSENPLLACQQRAAQSVFYHCFTSRRLQ